MTILRLAQTQEEFLEVLDSVTSIGPISSEVPALSGLTNPDLLLSDPPSQAELLTTATSSPSTSTPQEYYLKRHLTARHISRKPTISPHMSASER